MSNQETNTKMEELTRELRKLRYEYRVAQDAIIDKINRLYEEDKR